MKRRQWQEWKIGNFDDFCYPVQTKLQSIHYAQLTTIRLWVVALFTDISGSVVFSIDYAYDLAHTTDILVWYRYGRVSWSCVRKLKRHLET